MFRMFSLAKVVGRRSFSSTKIHQDILDNFVRLNSTERINKIFSSAFGAFRDPERADLVSALGDLTAYHALQNLRDKMMNDEVGRKILEDKPRVNDHTVHLDKLKTLEANKFGYIMDRRKYYEFMSTHGYKPEERPLVKYMPDYELAYILQRYKEIHDFIHVILSYNTNVMSEIAVKWFEMVQLGLPSTALSAFVGPFMLGRADQWQLIFNDINDIINNAKRCPLVLNVYWEKEFNTDIDELRERLGIQPLKS